MLFILFLSFLLFNGKIASQIASNSFSEIILTSFLFYSGSLILCGYILSYLNLWDSSLSWAILPFFLSNAGFHLLKNFKCIKKPISTFKLIGSNIQKMDWEVQSSTLFERIIFVSMFIGLVMVLSIQGYLVFFTPPNEWDSMTGHLNRILYFLQNGNLNHFIGTNFNVDTYPKSFSSVQVYPFLMNHKNEVWFKFQNLEAYFMLAFALYGSLKKLKISFKTAVLVASLYLFTPIGLIQSTTTDSDIVLAAYISLCVYYLISFAQEHERRFLIFAAWSFAIGFSHKITFVFALPSLFILIIGVYREFLNWNLLKTHIKTILVAIPLFLLLFTLPSGYLSNIKYYGHPIGPPSATAHQSIERAGSLENLLIQGSRNVLRYTFDLMNPDGIRNIPSVEALNKQTKGIWRSLDQHLNLGLESVKDFTIQPFRFDRLALFHRGVPIWGFVFLILLIGVYQWWKKKEKTKEDRLVFYLLIGAFLHFLTLAYTAPYDPWKGRYMQSTAVFAFPVMAYIGRFFGPSEKSIPTKFYWYILSLLTIASGVFTLLLHSRQSIIGMQEQPSILHLNRMQILTYNRPDIYPAYQRFDAIVPKNATVALATINDDFEYPLWGKTFERTLIPINPYEQGLQAIPPQADYLFFAKSLIQPQAGDIRLGTDTTKNDRVLIPGEDYYLRKLP